jgi:hypothetical protein
VLDSCAVEDGATMIVKRSMLRRPRRAPALEAPTLFAGAVCGSNLALRRKIEPMGFSAWLLRKQREASCCWNRLGLISV